MCEHLAALDLELKQRGIKETFRGQAWTKNTREWVYYDCVLVLDKVRQRFNFSDFVVDQVNSDAKSGRESGFFCERCQDGVMGLHPLDSPGKLHFE